METIKKGSQGSSVKTLQKCLGLTQDGIFGSGTESAVKAWLTKNHLTADGIVGPKSWELLLKNISTTSTISTTKLIDPSVNYSPLSVHVTKMTNRPIKYLAIHYTAGSSSKTGKAFANKAIFQLRQASADFVVDDTTMYLFNPDINNYYCWAVGDKKNPYSKGGKLYGVATNRNTVSIEVCSSLKSGFKPNYANNEGWYFTDAVLNNAAKLAKIIMNKYNIPLDHVIRHYDVSGKLCPGIIGWNDDAVYTNEGKITKVYSNSNKWLDFKNRLK